MSYKKIGSILLTIFTLTAILAACGGRGSYHEIMCSNAFGTDTLVIPFEVKNAAVDPVASMFSEGSLTEFQALVENLNGQDATYETVLIESRYLLVKKRAAVDSYFMFMDCSLDPSPATDLKFLLWGMDACFYKEDGPVYEYKILLPYHFFPNFGFSNISLNRLWCGVPYHTNAGIDEFDAFYSFIDGYITERTEHCIVVSTLFANDMLALNFDTTQSTVTFTPI